MAKHKLTPLTAPYIPAEVEEAVAKYWKENQTFEKSVENRPESNSFNFYDGPPFITGLPHYGHLLGSIVKDVIPRYQTMHGKRVRRVWGWDCHGLPAENKVEKQLGINSKKEIEGLGINKFVDACKAYVNNVSEQWAWYVERIGRWVDFENAYRTMDTNYMESVMWVFRQLYDKHLIYKGKRVSLFCPRCSTPISNFEVAMDNSYQVVSDPSIYVKFKLTDFDSYLLAWTTTPWTLPANFALAVDPKADYVQVRCGEQQYIVAKRQVEKVLADLTYEVVHELKGKDLVGKAYRPLYKDFPTTDRDHRVYGANFVTLEEGTGVVHIAPGFGEDDTKLGKEEQLSAADAVDEAGKLVAEVKVAPGVYFKKADALIIEDLKGRGLLLKSERISHNYPHCHRCATPLIYKAQEAWFIDVQRLKKQLLETNKDINWVPKHFKEGRFKLGIENAPDWCISRSRYWGSPLPVWETKSGWRFVPESIAELEKASGQVISDLHRPEIDMVTVKSPTGETAYRVSEVLDSWFEAASMPYAEHHFPFENADYVKRNFPADFITEYTGQLRAWFYVMHVISNALYQQASFENVIVTGVIMGTDGRKMSKNFGNYPDPKDYILKYGADALRLYLMGSPIVMGQDISINEADWQENLRGTLMILYNSYKFFANYAAIDNWQERIELPETPHVLDRWVLTRLNQAVMEMDRHLAAYEIPPAVKELKDFASDLSTWYIRRSRERVGPAAVDQQDKEMAYTTMRTVFAVFLKAAAPIIPFLSEYLYRHLTGEESVHLSDWPEVSTPEVIDTTLLNQMELVRKICELGHAQRKAATIAVKQPLSKITVRGKTGELEREKELIELIGEELNVEAVVFGGKAGDLAVELDTKITEDLKQKGRVREVIRTLQEARKEAGCDLNERVDAQLPDWPEKYEEEIKRRALIDVLTAGSQVVIVRK